MTPQLRRITQPLDFGNEFQVSKELTVAAGKSPARQPILKGSSHGYVLVQNLVRVRAGERTLVFLQF